MLPDIFQCPRGTAPKQLSTLRDADVDVSTWEAEGGALGNTKQCASDSSRTPASTVLLDKDYQVWCAATRAQAAAFVRVLTPDRSAIGIGGCENAHVE